MVFRNTALRLAGIAILVSAVTATGTIAVGNAAVPSIPISANILVDQFGYPATAQKVVVIRDAQIGFDAASHFVPGSRYVVEDAKTGERVFEGQPTAWQARRVDPSSGDRAFWFDFSKVTRPGRYYILDPERNVRSSEFGISDDVYRSVLKTAMRTFYYQRAGFEKKPEFAGAGWSDGASHLGPGQDKQARLYSAPDDARTERDLSGGWYDAGDYNRYTSWSARYVITLIKAYEDNPTVFSDDYGIPESGNGTPDILDEVKWGMDWLVRMQNPDGSVLSVLGVSQASPPSAAKGPSYYGPASTSATLSAAAAYAIGSRIFKSRGQLSYSDDLLSRAKRAYRWAEANPNVLFKNNDPASGTQGLAAGQQEVSDYTRLFMKLEAAVYLFEITGDDAYRVFFETNFAKLHLIENGYATPFEANEHDALLYYTKVPGATRSVSTAIRTAYSRAMMSSDNSAAIAAAKDPYRAYIKDYVWGSNSTKAAQGHSLNQLVTYGLAADQEQSDIKNAALGYLHYIHGINPLGLVYLTNMSGLGATRSVNEMFHAWFADGSPKWDRVGQSGYGPPPGFLVGGPNPSYKPDVCCPTSCGLKNVAKCTSESVRPPMGQPPQKSFKDFNTDWPLNSWEVTENSNAYQVVYIRLLSKFVK